MKFIRFMLIAGGLVFFALIGIGVLVGTSASHPRSSSSDARTDQSPQTSETGAPFIIRAGGRSYMGSEASQVGVAVMGVSTSPVVQSLMGMEQADGTFIFVTVGISNHQSTEITMNQSLFEIVDESGNVYSSSSKSFEVERGSDLFLAGINPGVGKQGTIVFDVPPSIIHQRLTLRFRGGMTGETTEVPLAVRSTAPVEAPVQEAAPEPPPTPHVSEAVDTTVQAPTPAPIVRMPPPDTAVQPSEAVPATPNQ
jgi:hypothetical protein